MFPVRSHPDDPTTPATPPRDNDAGPAPRGRLNLLLSYAGWDPEPWTDTLPRLLEPMGVTALCATSGLEASRVIQRHPVHIAVVDLGLPLEPDATNSEGGPRLLDILARLDQPPPTVIVKSAKTQRDEARLLGAALRAGAFAVIDRPRGPGDLELMLDVLRRCLHRFYSGRWPEPS